MRTKWPFFAAVLLVLVFATPRSASAQSLPAPKRDGAWEAVSNVSMAVGVGSQLLMPRIYWSDTEVTIGWKARWHFSVLAPTMFLMTMALFSELVVKPEITSYRPGCGPTNRSLPGCTTFGMPSPNTMASFSALGQGTATFVVDTLKWNDGKVHGGAIVGNIGVPLLAAGLSFAGRVAGEPSLEHFDQAAVGAGIGLGLGLITGAAYTLLQRPECPYGAGVICW